MYNFVIWNKCSKFAKNMMISDKNADDLVKVIILNEKYAHLSSDREVKDIHRLKKKYRGNTYVRLPFCIDEVNRKIVILDSDSDTADGYALVSKHELWPKYSDKKGTTKESRDKYAKQNCKDKLQNLAELL